MRQEQPPLLAAPGASLLPDVPLVAPSASPVPAGFVLVPLVPGPTPLDAAAPPPPEAPPPEAPPPEAPPTPGEPSLSTVPPPLPPVPGVPPSSEATAAPNSKAPKSGAAPTNGSLTSVPLSIMALPAASLMKSTFGTLPSARRDPSASEVVSMACPVPPMVESVMLRKSLAAGVIFRSQVLNWESTPYPTM